MEQRKIKITEDEWNRWSEMDKKGDHSWESEFCKKYVDESWGYGYGYYGVSLDYEKKIAVGLAGSTCD